MTTSSTTLTIVIKTTDTIWKLPQFTPVVRRWGCDVMCHGHVRSIWTSLIMHFVVLKTFFCLDGDHRFLTWKPFINGLYWNDYSRHLYVDSIILDPKEEVPSILNVVQNTNNMFFTLLSMNFNFFSWWYVFKNSYWLLNLRSKSIENSHVSTISYIFLFVCMPFLLFKNNFMIMCIKNVLERVV